MRHGDKINNLSRTTKHRKALLRNLANSLIQHKRIFTTLAKAKALRTFVEPILTKAKTDTQHHRRLVYSYLQNKEAVKILFREVSEKIANRNGGYTRIIKIGNRQGDAAEMAMIELVDFNQIYSGKPQKTEKKKTTRRSRKKSSTPATENKPAVENSNNSKTQE
ncbi:MAG: 50S ribosomal protein L17 [Bacteroidia bacterium]|nr:50S ribosomal protein L17 [Bacteroidia bacterium]